MLLHRNGRRAAVSCTLQPLPQRRQHLNHWHSLRNAHLSPPSDPSLRSPNNVKYLHSPSRSVLRATRPSNCKTYASGNRKNQDKLRVGQWADHLSRESERGIAVLGGGITGLATTYYLAKDYPHRPITLYERSDRFGGWIETDAIDVPGGKVLFDTGPKTLRPDMPNGGLALKLVDDLGLKSDFLPFFDHEPAAQNRFLYYPDHLVQMPGKGMSTFESLWPFWSEPVWDKFFPSAITEWNKPTRSPEIMDESVARFVSRRLHPSIAENVVSAVFHGVYAGDINNLSARQVLKSFWMRETRCGSLSQSFYMQQFQKQSWWFCDDIEISAKIGRLGLDPELAHLSRRTVAFSFKKGLSMLSEALESHLKALPNVTLVKNSKLTSISKSKTSSNLVIETKPSSPSKDTSHKPAHYRHVISTIPPKELLSLTYTNHERGPKARNQNDFDVLERTIGSTSAVNVGVVNLYYLDPYLLNSIKPPGGLPSTSTIRKNGFSGFGYLIPASIPTDQNPECALGVQFDSDITPDMWSSVSPEQRGTKLTVMLGGHWWDGLESSGMLDDLEKDHGKDMGNMAMDVLERHLGITELPYCVQATVHRNCIPQYTVGHGQRMEQAHDALWNIFNGRLRVAGNWYNGVGVNDCLRAAHDVAEGLVEEDTPHTLKSQIHRTGLEKFVEGDRPMALVSTKMGSNLEVVRCDLRAFELGFQETLDKYFPKARPPEE